MGAPEVQPWPLVTVFTLRENEDRLIVGPQNHVRDGVIRVTGAGLEQVFRFHRDGSFATNAYTNSNFNERDVQFEVPQGAVEIPGIRVFYNVWRGWLCVERTSIEGQRLVVSVEFPGNQALSPTARHSRRI